MRVFLYNLREMFFGERERWFMWLPVLFACGIGVYFLLPAEPSRWIILAVVEILLALAYVWRHRPGHLAAVLVLTVAALGFADIQLKTIYLSRHGIVPFDRKLYLTGRVSELGRNYRGNPRFVLEDIEDFDGNSLPGRYRVSLTSKSSQPENGRCVELIGTVSAPPHPNMVGGYQMDRKLFYEGINASGYAASRALPVECSKEPPFTAVLEKAASDLRGRVVAKINAVLPPDEAGITAAIVAGDRSGIRQEITENYRNSGLAHFLSISGLHMSMLAGLMFFLVRLLLALIPPLALCYDSKKTAAVFAILMSAVYLVISGAEIPSQRAFIMTFIVLLGVLFARKAISMRMISWAALIVLVISPQALISASFQMSFAAVAALIAFYERFAGGLHRFLNGHENAEISLPSKVVRIVFAYVAGILVSDLVASLATLPFSIYHFNQIAVYTTFGNLLAGPVIGLIIMPFVLIALLLMPFNMEVWALKIVGFGVEKVNEITAYVASLPEAGYRVAAMPFWGLMLIVFGGLWLCIWRLKWRRWGWVLILAGSLSIFTVRIPDVMADKYGEVFAVKDEQGRLVILPSRGNAFTKKIWLEKTANRKLSAKESRKLKDIYDGKKTDRSWIDMECDERVCVYKDAVVIVKFGGIEIGERDFDLYAAEGAQFFVNGHGKVQAETVRSYIGRRPWN